MSFNATVGEEVHGPDTFRVPTPRKIEGRYVDLHPLDASDLSDLYTHMCGSANTDIWTYLPAGPFDNREAFYSYLRSCASSKATCFWIIFDRKAKQYVGHISFLNINSGNATIEIGNIAYAHSLQRTSGASEAWYLLAKEVFDCQFRRLEWKCNALNGPSRRAAERFGHVFEGVFRQHMIVKGRNRDTAWYSIIDTEWWLVKMAFEYWLAHENFDGDGKQKESLVTIRNRLAPS